MKTFLAKCGAYLIAPVVFFLFACIFCNPPGDDKIIASGDNYTFIGAAHASVEYANKTGGKGSWWTESMFSGMPNYQIGGGAKYKSKQWLSPLTRFLHRGINRPIWSMFYYFLGFYILLLAFNVSPWISLLGALSIGMSTYFVTLIPAGHNTKMITIALTAVVVAGFKFIFDKKYILGAVLTMVFVATGFSPHPQMFYYYCMLIGMLWVAELWKHIKEKKGKDMVLATSIFALSMFIGIGTGSSYMLVNSEFVKESTRSGSVLDKYDASTGKGDVQSAESNGLGMDYVLKWSNGLDESFSMLIPGFKGGSSFFKFDKNSKFSNTLNKHGYVLNYKALPMYWGPQSFTYGTNYVGAVICFLFLLGILIVKGPYKWILLACSVLSIMLSWGGNFPWLTNLFYKYFPMYSKFRAVSSIQIVAEITMPLLGLLAVKEVMDGDIDRKKVLRSVAISAGICVGICLFFAVAGGFLYDFQSGHDDFMAQLPEWAKTAFKEERHMLFTKDCLRSILFVLAAATLVLAQIKWKLKSLPAYLALCMLSVCDIWPIDHRFFNETAYTTVKKQYSEFTKTGYEKYILQDTDPHFRVYNTLNNPFNDSRTSFYLESVGGYSAVKLSRYEDLIKEHLSKNHRPVFNMLNTKYVILPGVDGGEPEVVKDEDALGNVWFVKDVRWVDNPRDEIDLLCDEDINLGETAIVNKEFESFLDGKSFSKRETSRILLKEFAPNHLEYTSFSTTDGLAVFSEIYYPYGWVSKIDGQEQAHFRVNYVLRALTIPAGQHTITFDFDPQSVKTGDRIAISFIILMYTLVAAALVFWIVRLIRDVRCSDNTSRCTRQ